MKADIMIFSEGLIQRSGYKEVDLPDFIRSDYYSHHLLAENNFQFLEAERPI